MPSGKWAHFEHDVASWVKGYARPGLTFCGGYQAIPGFPSDSFRADALLTDGRHLLAVEIEVCQTHPDTNVGKYWLLSRYKRYESIVLFHIYTPAFNSYPWRLELGRFYASHMASQLPFEYVLLDRRRDSDVESTFNDVTGLIRPRIEAMFARERSHGAT